MSTLWSGRFDSAPDAEVFAYGKSLSVDRRLIEDDIIASLKPMREVADVIVAADVLTYIGDLKELFIQIARVLRTDGCFTATIEKPEDGNAKYVLQKTRRYAHSENYIRRLAAAALFDMVSMEPFAMRREGESDAQALAFVLRKKP